MDDYLVTLPDGRLVAASSVLGAEKFEREFMDKLRVVVREEIARALEERVSHPDALDNDCLECSESDAQECPRSLKPCGHHCNHVWTHDACHYCGYKVPNDDDPGGVREPAAPEPPGNLGAIRSAGEKLVAAALAASAALTGPPTPADPPEPGRRGGARS